MSIASKLEYLDETKAYIRECIQKKGVTVPTDTTFRKYGDKILEIETENHPPDWGGDGDGSETGKLTVGSALANGTDFVLSPPEGYDGFSSVNVIGDPNLKPENIAYGVTIYGVTGKMDVPTNMTTIPPEYSHLFEQAREQWSGEYSGLMILESDEAVAFGFILSGFNVETYNEESTEFEASRWVYVAYNKKTATWKVENWESGTSNGGSFIRNIRYCDRYLYYEGKVIYPFLLGLDPSYIDPERKYTFSFIVDLTKITNFQLRYNFAGSAEIDWGDDSEPTVHTDVAYQDTRLLAHVYREKKEYTITIYGRPTHFGAYYQGGATSLVTYITRYLTPIPPTMGYLGNILLDNKFLETLPSNLFSQVPDNSDVKYIFSQMLALHTLPDGILDSFTHSSDFTSIASKCESLYAIPDDLFVRNIGMTNITTGFIKCTSLQSIPSGLFKSNRSLTIASSLFSDCTGLTEIPSDLFENCALITNVSNIFSDCTGLTAIPPGLFKNCKLITTFSMAFNGCSKVLTISKDIFPETETATNLSNVFYGCVRLTDIPEDIFDNIQNPSSISSAFYNCVSVTTKVPEFWNEDKYGNKFTSISHSKCFYGCTNASNYGDIPEGWK